MAYIPTKMALSDNLIMMDIWILLGDKIGRSAYALNNANKNICYVGFSIKWDKMVGQARANSIT